VQWLQDQNQGSVDNLNNVTHEDSRHFMSKKKEYLKARMMYLKLTVRTVRSKISETCIVASLDLRMATSLELT